VTDPAGADADFGIQGEYVGEANPASGSHRLGAQIVAIGKGRFRATFYCGGLPGDGWERSRTKENVASKNLDGAVTFAAAKWRATVSDGALVIADVKGDQMGRLRRVVRQSPTLGKAPPQGAVVLFNGTSTKEFQRGRVTDDGLLIEGATTKRKFQSFRLHLEFRTPYKPHAKGQGRGNSGVYIQRRYEVQILDSFGLEGKSNECGGLYKVARPNVNMCFPPLSWQTYDIDFRAAQFDENGKKIKNAVITVLHNGVEIHQELELPNKTGSGAKEGPTAGPIYLQNHGNPVRFRNIWVVEQ